MQTCWIVEWALTLAAAIMKRKRIDNNKTKNAKKTPKIVIPKITDLTWYMAYVTPKDDNIYIKCTCSIACTREWKWASRPHTVIRTHITDKFPNKVPGAPQSKPVEMKSYLIGNPNVVTFNFGPALLL